MSPPGVRPRPLGAALAAVVLLVACRGAEPPPRPTNLVILSVDTLRYDALAHAGGPVPTPRIDSLASGGTVFTHAIAPMPRTTPSLGSLLTGLWPKRHGSREVGDPIREVPTLAELLRIRGFQTFAVSTNDSASPKQHLDRGFDHFVSYQDLLARHGDNLYRDLTEVPADRPGWASATTGAALELLGNRDPDRPFFLWAFYFDPHFLYRPPEPWQNGVTADRCWALYNAYDSKRDRAGEIFANVGGVASEAAEDCRRLYDAEVGYVDQQIGLVLDALDAEGLRDETLIVFTADHGENFGEGGLYFEHGDNAHDAAIRVPLVFAGPGIAVGQQDAGAVSLTDVVPTVLTVLGVPETKRPPLDGEDLSRRLRPGAGPSRRDTGRIVFSESASALWNQKVDEVVTGRDWWRICINGPRFTLCEIPKEAPGVFLLYDHELDPGLDHDIAAEHPEQVVALQALWSRWPLESARDRVARTARFKLIETPKLEGGYTRILVDLTRDAEEARNVSAEHPEVFRALGAALDEWTADIPDVEPRPYDPELEETLRSLGYIR